MANNRRTSTAAKMTATHTSLKPEDWAMLVVGSGGAQATTPVQLQKVLFLAERHLTAQQRKVSKFYKFDAYDYGPFSKDIYSDLEKLAADHLVQIDVAPGRTFRTYRPTSDGLKRYGEIRAQLDTSVAEYAEALSKWARSLSFNDLVKSIYKMHPEMKVNSVFQLA